MTTRILLAFLLLTSSVFGQGSGSVAVVPNVAALTNRPPSALNPVVSVSGYRTNGDWGQARTIRYVPTSTNAVDNGCVFPTSTGVGRWEAADCDGPVMLLAWFGTYGDGVTDDTDRIQAAFNAARDGATLLLAPHRTNRIETSVVLTNKGLTIDLAGSTILPTDDATQQTVLSAGKLITQAGIIASEASLAGALTTNSFSVAMALPSATPGRLVQLWSSNTVAGGNYNIGQLAFVVSNDGANLVLDRLPWTNFVADSAWVYAAVSNVVVRNGRFDLSQSYRATPVAIYGREGLVENCVFEDDRGTNATGYIAIDFMGENLTAARNKIRNILDNSGGVGRSGYGVFLSGYNVIAVDNVISDCKHGIATSQRKSRSFNLTARNNRITQDPEKANLYSLTGDRLYVAALDGHANLDHYVVEGNVLQYGRYGMSIRSGNAIVRDNRMEMIGDISDGLIHFHMAFGESATRNLTIENNQVTGPSTRRLIWWDESESSVVENVRIVGNTSYGGRLELLGTAGGSPLSWSNVVVEANAFRGDGPSIAVYDTASAVRIALNYLVYATNSGVFWRVTNSESGNIIFGNVFRQTGPGSDIEVSASNTIWPQIVGNWLTTSLLRATNRQDWAAGTVFPTASLGTDGLRFGSGTAAPTLWMGYNGPLEIGFSNANYLQFTGSAGNLGGVLYHKVSGDAVNRLELAMDGITFGSGASARNAGMRYTAAQTLTLSNNIVVPGTISLGGVARSTWPIGLSDGDNGDVTVSGSGATWTIDADSVALGTDTTGNYVASVSGTANEVSASGSGEGAAVTVSLPSTIDLGGKTSFELPNAAAPTVDAFGEIAGDNDAWAAGRGAAVFYDGTAATRLVGVLASDTPTAGQVAKWQTGGTITWEDDQTGAGGLSDGDKGDVTVSGSGATWTIDADAVALGTDTTGNYVASVAGTANEVSASGSGEGAAVTLSLPATIDLGGKTSFELPNAAAPTVDAFGEIAGDDDAWAAGRGAPVFYDGTAATRLVGVLASDTPTAGQVPKWQTGGTITWEDDQTGAGGLSDGDKGDITVSGSGATWTIDADSVALGTDTTGNYVASVTGTANEVDASGSGEGAAVTVSLPTTIDLGGKTSFELPNAAAPTVDAFGEIAGDNDAWAASRGAAVFYDGTAATRLVGVLSSDTPTAGQVPKWQTGGTITWEDDQTGAGGLSDGDKGDVTVSGSGATWTIDADAVALGTDTTGNYVASVTGTANEVSASGSGEGAAVTVSLPTTIDLGGKTSFELPNAAAPTVDAFGEIAGDNDAWAAGRGAVVAYDGTAATRLVGVLSSDTPSNGQFPRWNTDGTITWENVPTVTNAPVTGLWQTLGFAEIIVENLGTDTSSVTYTNYSGIVTNLSQIGSGGSNHRLQLSMTFNESIGTNYLVIFDFDGADDTDSSYALAGWSQSSARSTSSCEVSIVNTDGFVYSNDGFKIRIRIVNPNATAGGSGGAGDVGTTADNILSGVNQFTNGLGQVFSVPPRVLGGRINGWTAPQMTPGTNASTQAQFKVLGDGIPSVEFDGATSEEISMVGLLSQDPDSGSFVTITFASDDTANTVCWQAQWQLLTLRGIDTNLLSSAATWTSNIPGTARVPTNITFALNAPTGLLGSTNDFSKPYMLRVTRLPGSDSSLSNAYLIGVDHRYGR